jgi:hypothetical protein
MNFEQISSTQKGFSDQKKSACASMQEIATRLQHEVEAILRTENDASLFAEYNGVKYEESALRPTPHMAQQATPSQKRTWSGYLNILFKRFEY